MTWTQSKHGLSLMETVIGLAMFGLIASAVAAFASATGAAWEQGRVQSPSRLAATRASVAVDELLRGTCALIWVDSEEDQPAAALIWEADRLLEPDGLAQVGELMLVEHDADAGALLVYRVMPWDGMTETQREVAKISDWSSVNWQEFARSFKELSIVADPTPLAGIRAGRSQGNGIIAARIDAVRPAGGRPSISLDLVLDDGVSRQRLLSSVTLRVHQSASNLALTEADSLTDPGDDADCEDEHTTDDDSKHGNSFGKDR